MGFQSIAYGFLAWPQFTLLTTPRHGISSRFQLNTPSIAGLFYVAPACGFLAGSIAGGRLFDRTVKHRLPKKRKRKRRGVRFSEDRLRSGIVSFLILTLAVYLIFGWGMEYNPCSRPWLAVPIITAFVVAAGILDAMTGLNKFCAEVLPGKRGDAIASKYMTQYTLLAVASGVAVMLIDTIGLGPACTIGKLPLKCA